MASPVLAVAPQLLHAQAHGNDQVCGQVGACLKYGDAALIPPPGPATPGILGQRDGAAHLHQSVRQPCSEELGTTFPHVCLPLPCKLPDPVQVAGGPHLGCVLSLDIMDDYSRFVSALGDVKNHWTIAISPFH